MFNKDALPPDAQQYFNSLPMFLKESIIQAGLEFKNKQDLVSFCEYVDHDNP